MSESRESSSTIELDIRGMHCGSCVSLVEKALHGARGVRTASVNLATQHATVLLQADAGPPDPDDLVLAVRKAGYDADPVDARTAASRNRADERAVVLRAQIRGIMLALAFGTPVVAVALAERLLGWRLPGVEPRLLWIAQALLTLAVFASAAGSMFAGALRALLAGGANMDVLVVLGAGTAFVSGVIGTVAGERSFVLFEAAVMIVVFVSVGKMLEARSRGQASAALEALLTRIPREALRVVGEKTETVAIDDVQVGDVLRVAAHRAVPVDGEIISGRATVDEAMLTGESLPVERERGGQLLGGTRVVDGLVDLRATATSGESAATRIARLVEQAQASKPRLQRLADRLAGVFVPCVVFLALATFAAWILLSDAGTLWALKRAITVLVVACPCAMGLAIPTAVLVGTTRAAEHGILVRDASALEAAGRVREVLLDKTGTLTMGHPQLERIEPMPGHEESEALRAAVALEQFSEHPLAAALVRAARTRGIDPPDPDEFESQPGRGLRGSVNGVRTVVGSAAWLAANDVSPDGFVERADHLAASGASVIWVAQGGVVTALLAFADPVHPESAAAIAELHRMGIRTRILSGDRHAAVSHIAGVIGVDTFEAELSPDDKLERVRALTTGGHRVAMVGDGINDAPALAAADVGIAIGTGADVAREAADICLVGHSPRLIAEAVRISRASARVMKQNLFWALIYNVIMLPVAVLTALPPSLATVAMMFSSLSVVGNSLRLRRML